MPPPTIPPPTIPPPTIPPPTIPPPTFPGFPSIPDFSQLLATILQLIGFPFGFPA